MTLEEIGHLLGLCAAYDRRTVGETDIRAWHAAVGDIPFSDARDAVLAHYRSSREWIMPADVRAHWTTTRPSPHRTVAEILGPRIQLADPVHVSKCVAETRVKLREIASQARAQIEPPEQETA